MSWVVIRRLKVFRKVAQKVHQVAQLTSAVYVYVYAKKIVTPAKEGSWDVDFSRASF